MAIANPAWSNERETTDFASRALALAPRIRLDCAARVLWADTRGLDGLSIARQLLALASEWSWNEARAGLASVPIAALVAARFGTPDDRITVVPNGEEGAFLAPFDVSQLEPPPAPSLYPLLASVGIDRCGDLAKLDHESVEVRFGAEGVRVWRLARGDDPRLMFGSSLRELPHAELEWVDYELDRQEQVVFIVHSLLGTVCDAVGARGQGAHALTLEFSLTNRARVEHPVRCSAPTADRRTWLRIIRTTLEQVTFEAPVTRIGLRVDAVTPLSDRQGDLFDMGFATARATEAALAHLLDKQGDALMVAERTRHPLPEQRITWVAGEDSESRYEMPFDPTLTLQILGAPRQIEVRLAARREGEYPVRYRDGYTVYSLADSMGPDRVSGGFGAMHFDREYYQSVRTDGMVVLLYRDVTDNRWFLGGWWD